LLGRKIAENNYQDVKPAKDIIDDMVKEAKKCLESGAGNISQGARAKL